MLRATLWVPKIRYAVNVAGTDKYIANRACCFNTTTYIREAQLYPTAKAARGAWPIGQVYKLVKVETEIIGDKF